MLPLRDKAYVISAISFRVIYADELSAICIPQRVKILHDNGTIDLVDRLRRIGEFLGRSDIPVSIREESKNYQAHRDEWYFLRRGFGELQMTLSLG